MRALILGGYGVFGGRLARLLIRDGVDVVIAGRNLEAAAAFARAHGGEPLRVDVRGDLSPILSHAPAVVIDVAGPFQAYAGNDPYRVPRFCIAHGMHYLDLSDDAEFTAGIATLNREAIEARCLVLSGVSSVPAISAAAVRALSRGVQEIVVIETSLVPGNRSPRGRSVIASVLNQAGAPLVVWRGGVWRRYSGWGDPKRVDFGSGIRRTANLIGAPDLKLFPHEFRARSVIFRAGLELRLMHQGLALLARMRGLIGDLGRLTDPLRRIARLLEPLGTDIGGMAVDVTGLVDGEPIRRRWQLIAAEGEGPFIPAVPARAILRQLERFTPGARPCLADLDLPQIETAMSDLSVHTSFHEEPAPTLIPRVLGERWLDLPETVRRLHSVQDLESFSGWAKVARGRGLLARLTGWFFGFPRAAEAVPVTVTKMRTASGEIWERNFGGRVFRSHLSPSVRPGHCDERFGPMRFELALAVDAGRLFFPVSRGWIFGIPLPAFLLPRSEACEYEANGRFHFDVSLYAPMGGELIVRYQGSVEPDCAPAAEAPPPAGAGSASWKRSTEASRPGNAVSRSGRSDTKQRVPSLRCWITPASRSTFR